MTMSFSSKISAIKALRDMVESGSYTLRGAKDFVEAVMELGVRDESYKVSTQRDLAEIEDREREPQADGNGMTQAESYALEREAQDFIQRTLK